ncbi:helix-turn-helix transcriptional regulator [Streptacidiphilus pinicola]|uniref:Helix-turn-helix transcriptional regulator n=2 Tax=Streptacidiphilus pinicola TaxID=2219663 RepID=A0A2X0KEE1_9ACTN|nr:helix-turn-helix transcriptional regulator [Streptacidiphilus pinicola]
MAVRFAVPVLPAESVHRPRLVGRLAEGVRGPLVLVTGPAGAGKTLLAADWFRTVCGTGRAAWLTLEQSDNEPGRFWTYVLEAMRYHGVPLPADIQAPYDPRGADPALLGRLAAHLHSQDQPVVLVLDEFDRIALPQIAAELHELIRHAGAGLRLVLVSRTDPLLPLYRYRLTGELTCVRAADLAFSAEETIELFTTHGLAVTEESIRALTTRLDGWAAGLRLAALAAQEAPDPEASVRDFETGQGAVADFLTNEVLAAQPAETQDLLLRTCVLDQIHPDLADALTGRRDGARILDDLDRANAFLTPLGHSWYRQHPLFAEILRIRLHVRQPDLERVVHVRAARWLGEHGQLMAALTHAAQGEDWEFAAVLLVRSLAVWRLLVGRDAERLAHLFAAMPPETPGPAPALARAVLELARHDPDRAVAHLRAAEATLGRDSGTGDGNRDRTGDAALRLTAACLRALAARQTGSVEMAEAAVAQAAQLRAQLPPELVEAHPELSAHLMDDLGAVLLKDGRFAEAGRALATAVETPDAPDTAQPRHDSLCGLGLIELLDGRLTRAQEHARAAMAEARRSALPPGAGTGAGQLVLAEVAIDRGELAAADAELRSADAAVGDNSDAVVTQELSVAHSLLLLADGKPKAALDALQAPEPAVQAAAPWLADRVAATAAAAHLAAGHPDAALDALRDADRLAPEPAVASARARLALGEPEKALHDLVELDARDTDGSVVDVQAMLTRAQAVDALGDPATARRLVRAALDAAHAERLWLPFRLAAPWLCRVLNGDPGLTRPHPWLPPDLRPAPAPDLPLGAGTDELPAVIPPLSEREREVLARAAELMSTEEIATDLFLSVNTVKTHLKSINRKLAASRRGEAVRRARRLNLL